LDVRHIFHANANAAGTPAAAARTTWAKPSIGVFSFVLFAAALFVTWKYDKEQAFNLLIGAVIANATTVIGYYFGSSSGSAQKTALLATLPPPRPGGG